MTNKKTTFTYTTADGIVETRTSLRSYTHVVVGRLNLALMRAEACSEAARKQHLKNWQWDKQKAETPVGQPYDARRSTWLVSNETRIAEGRAALEQYPTPDAYVEEMVARNLARINEDGTADTGPERVLQWSMSEVNAFKSISQHSKYHVAVRVVPLA